MFDILLSATLSFAITYFAIPVIIFVANNKKLYDIPDARKVHAAPIPSLGGLGIFAGCIIACLFTVSFGQATEFQYFVAAALVIFFLGLKDDILDISPVNKFIGQAIAAFILIYKGGVQIKSMHGFLGVYEMPEIYSLLLTYFTVLVVINSFNLIDGVDGLAGSLGLMTSLILGAYFVKINLLPYALLSFAMGGSLAAFLIFNFQPAKIFMGDTGSLLIGLLSSVLVIKFINVSSANSSFPITESSAIGFSILMIPLLDTLRVFGTRILKRRSPFSPDRNHLHHILLDKGLSHRNVTLTLVTVNVLFIVYAYMGRKMGSTYVITSIVALFFTGIALLKYIRPAKRLSVAKRLSNSTDMKKPTTKVINLAKNTVLEEN